MRTQRNKLTTQHGFSYMINSTLPLHMYAMSGFDIFLSTNITIMSMAFQTTNKIIFTQWLSLYHIVLFNYICVMQYSPKMPTLWPWTVPHQMHVCIVHGWHWMFLSGVLQCWCWISQVIILSLQCQLSQRAACDLRSCVVYEILLMAGFWGSCYSALHVMINAKLTTFRYQVWL